MEAAEEEKFLSPCLWVVTCYCLALGFFLFILGGPFLGSQAATEARHVEQLPHLVCGV